MVKPTLMDVAAAAGVSYATADRVLNRRGGVAEKSVLRVLAAIEQLGYTRDVTAANLARGRSYNYAFLIPAQAGTFFGEMRAAVKAEAKARASQRINIMIEEVPAFNSDGLAEVLESCLIVIYQAFALLLSTAQGCAKPSKRCGPKTCLF